MRSITASDGTAITVDDEDLAYLSQWKWHIRRGSRSVYAWARIERDGVTKHTYMHRLLVDPPSGLLVDHINGDSLDNRRSNLRTATPSQNSQNRRTTPPSGYRGVTRHKGRNWQAQLTYGGKNHYLGVYTDAVAAARAYDSKALELFGDYARLNFPHDASMTLSMRKIEKVAA